MALSIGVNKGKKILVDRTHMLIVREVLTPTRVRVTFDGREILLTDLERAELMPNVFVSCGLSGKTSTQHYARLAFEAPRAVRIERIQR